MNKQLILGLIIITMTFMTSCFSNEDNSFQIKATEDLSTQFNLRQEQIADPTEARLEIMKGLGMNVEDISVQSVFIYLKELPSASQQNEIRQLGITLYIDSWIPPVGVHPTGFLIAKVPVDKMADLAAKDYVIRLDSAERVNKPQNLPSTG
ncbi:MAG: hypothetical protein ACRKGH_07775 [Dehalogenimonas sp.]